MADLHPKVGVGVMVMRDGKVLLCLRKGSHGAGEYAFPGGHLEHMESFEQCARREAKEECGITIKNVRFLFLANLKRYAPKHYAHVGLLADWASGEPTALEPEFAENWQWYSFDNLPKPLFETCTLSVESFLTGKNYFDS